MLDTLDIRVEREDLIPVRTHTTDAGLDLVSKDFVNLPAYTRVLVGTGVSVRIPKGYVGLLLPRSSLSKRGVVMTNSCGVIDSDYRGEIMASLMLVHPDPRVATLISKGERVVQLLILPIALPTIQIVTESDTYWNDTVRGSGGFGSTGKL